jgi:glyoxylase-like metal-dependent hydrolase (beta-lactamase superfamily II)
VSVQAALEAAGVRRALVPVPVPVPPTNAWILGEGDVTMIDCGVRSPEGLGPLAGALEQGERVETLLVTHGHPDHHGCASLLQEAHGCTVRCHPFDAPAVSHFSGTIRGRFDRWAAVAREQGAPAPLIGRMEKHYARIARLGEDAKVGPPLRDGERVRAGSLDLEVVHLPGHTAGSVGFYDAAGKTLFSGDSVLPGITPNPFFNGISDNPSGPGPFLDSIARLRKMDIDLVLPGHGEPLMALPGVLDAYERHHQERREAIVGHLLERQAATGFEIVRALFPEAKELDMWLALAEVYGHLQFLSLRREVEPTRGPDGGPAWRLVR